MRRIPRIRTPSGLSSTTPPHVRSISGSAKIAQSYHSQPSHNSPQRPTIRSLCPSHLNRFYSSSSDKPTSTPTQVTESSSGKDLELKADEDHLQEWAEEDVDDLVSSGPYVAPPSRVDAAREEEVADPTYVPATSADGLKTVGGLGNWWNQPQNWNSGGNFSGFRPKTKITDPALIEASVRRAVIEALALKEVGREEDLVGVWPTRTSKADIQNLLSLDVQSHGNDGVVSLGGDATAVAEGLRWKDEEPVSDHGNSDMDALTPEEAADLNKSWDPSWKSISIADARIRFAVCTCPSPITIPTLDSYHCIIPLGQII